MLGKTATDQAKRLWKGLGPWGSLVIRMTIFSAGAFIAARFWIPAVWFAPPIWAGLSLIFGLCASRGGLGLATLWTGISVGLFLAAVEFWEHPNFDSLDRAHWEWRFRVWPHDPFAPGIVFSAIGLLAIWSLGGIFWLPRLRKKLGPSRKILSTSRPLRLAQKWRPIVSERLRSLFGNSGKTAPLNHPPKEQKPIESPPAKSRIAWQGPDLLADREAYYGIVAGDHRDIRQLVNLLEGDWPEEKLRAALATDLPAGYWSPAELEAALGAVETYRSLVFLLESFSRYDQAEALSDLSSDKCRELSAKVEQLMGFIDAPGSILGNWQPLLSRLKAELESRLSEPITAVRKSIGDGAEKIPESKAKDAEDSRRKAMRRLVEQSLGGIGIVLKSSSDLAQGSQLMMRAVAGLRLARSANLKYPVPCPAVDQLNTEFLRVVNHFLLQDAAFALRHAYPIEASAENGEIWQDIKRWEILADHALDGEKPSISLEEVKEEARRCLGIEAGQQASPEQARAEASEQALAIAALQAKIRDLEIREQVMTQKLELEKETRLAAEAAIAKLKTQGNSGQSEAIERELAATKLERDQLLTQVRSLSRRDQLEEQRAGSKKSFEFRERKIRYAVTSAIVEVAADFVLKFGNEFITFEEVIHCANGIGLALHVFPDDVCAAIDSGGDSGLKTAHLRAVIGAAELLTIKRRLKSVVVLLMRREEESMAEDDLLVYEQGLTTVFRARNLEAVTDYVLQKAGKAGAQA